MFCFNCGVKLDSSAKFCANCGSAQAPVSPPPPQPQPPQQPQPLPPPPQQQSPAFSSAAEQLPPPVPPAAAEDVKVWKSVVVVVVIVALLIGGLIFGVLWLFNIGSVGDEIDYHHMDESLLEEPIFEEADIEEPDVGEQIIEEPDIAEPDSEEPALAIPDLDDLRRMLFEEILAGDEAHLAGLERFEEAIRAMHTNGGTISREGMIEILGDIYTPCEIFEHTDGLVFILTSQLEVTARNFGDDEGVFTSVHISRHPAVMTDLTLELDEALLRSYAESYDELTYEYFLELIGVPGRITSYSYNSFTYSWRSLDVMLNINVDNYGVARSMFMRGEEVLDVRLDNASPEVIRDVTALFSMLAHEMDENYGYTTTRNRVTELFGDGYVEEVNENNFRLTFNIGFNLTVTANGRDDVVSSISMWGMLGTFRDENLVIDGAVIREYSDNWWDIEREDRPTLRYFERMFGRSGTISMYTNGSFWHEWDSPDYNVRIAADRDGIVITVGIHENLW